MDTRTAVWVPTAENFFKIVLGEARNFSRMFMGGVPTTPDPNISAKVSRYKWEAYRDANWWCIHYSLPSAGHTFAQKVSR